MVYSGDLLPEEFNMARYCLAPEPHRPADKIALVVISDRRGLEAAETWSYGAIEDAVLRVAAGLKSLGLEHGDRILIRLDNTSVHALLFFGALAGGFVPLPASSTLSPREITFFLENCGAKAIARSNALTIGDIPLGVRVLDEHDVASLLSHGERADYAATCADDPAFLIYTSGTSADPKGVLHAHRSAWGRRPMYQGWYGISGRDRMLHAGAFNWTFTLGTGLTDPWANGATALIYNGEQDIDVWPRIIAQHKITLFAAVPGLYRQILKYCNFEKNEMASLRHGLIAGERLPYGLREEWHQRTGTQLFEAIGMSELSTYISSSPTVPAKPGAIGKPQDGRMVAILPVEEGQTPLPAGEIGIIAVHRSDPGLMLGYWERPDEDARMLRGDWFLTGDLGSMDKDGYIAHHGRSDDLMNAQGYRVSPDEIERELSAHPDIADIAAVEIQVRLDVSLIGAFIVLNAGAVRNPASIQNFAQERLAAYKVPREYIFLDALPRTPNGKIKRSELAAHFRGAG